MAARFLRRYTDLPSLLYLLSERKLSLLNPDNWDDSNDSYLLNLYRTWMGLASVLAVCFTQVDETYHHWRVFAPGPSGICIRFKRAELLGQLDDQSGIRMGAVSYLKLIAMRRRTPPFDDLPFLKRQAFANEREFRVIYESKRGHKEKLDIPIPLACIDKITLSPWLHPALFPNARSMLKSITGVRPIPIVHSTLVSSTQWKSLAEKVAKRGHNSRQVLSSQSSDSPTHSTSTLSAGA